MSISLSKLVGGNAQRLRLSAGATQQELAQVAARLGLPWTDQHVSRVERGRWSPDLTQLVLIAAALDRLPGGTVPVAVADLVTPPEGIESEPVALTETISVSAEDLADILRGQPAGPRIPQLTPAERVPVRGRRTGYAAVDRRVAAELGLSADNMLEASRGRWGRSLSEERADRIARRSERLGVPLRQPEKAAITAELREELNAHLERRRQSLEPVQHAGPPPPLPDHAADSAGDVGATAGA
jgi:transcriptional regulator with XRE-family HTH domain